MDFLHTLSPWWWALAALPLAIHLLSRRVPRRQDWGAMRLLRLALARQRRRYRMRHWVLLVVRTAALTAMLVAFLSPVFERADDDPGGLLSRGQHYVLVLDVSGSMQTRRGAEGTRFDQARAEAARVLARLRAGDGATLLVTPGPAGAPAAVIAAGEDLAALRAALAEIEVTARPSVALELAALRPPGVPDDARAFLFTDGSLPEPPADAPGPAPRDAEPSGLTPHASRLAWTVVPIGADETPVNWRLAQLRLDAPAVRPGATVRFEAVVAPPAGDQGLAASSERRGEGEPPGEPSGSALPPLRFRLDDGPWRPLDGPATADPRHAGWWLSAGRFAAGDAPGTRRLEVEVQVADALDADNRAFRAVPVREQWRVLAVDGEPDGEPERGRFRGELAYAALAVEALERMPQAVPVLLDRVGPDTMLAALTDEPDLLLLANVTRLSAAQVAAIEGLLARGGAVWVLLGDQTDADAWAELFRTDDAGWLPARPLAMERPDAPFAARAVDPDAARWRALAAPGQPPAFDRLRIEQYWRVRAHPAAETLLVLNAPEGQGQGARGKGQGEEAETPPASPTPHASSLSAGAPRSASSSALSPQPSALGTSPPLLLARPFRAGMVWLWTAGFDSEWSNLPAWGLFPAFLVESLGTLAARRGAAANGTLDRALELRLPPGRWLAAAEGRRPGETDFLPVESRPLPAAPGVDQGRLLALEAAPLRPGWGELRWRHAEGEPWQRAFFGRDFAPQESPGASEAGDEPGLGPDAPETWRRRLHLGAAPVLRAPPLTWEHGDDPGRGGRWLWWAVLALVLGELALAGLVQEGRAERVSAEC